MTAPQEIDGLLAAEKTLLGEPHWREDGSRPERALLVAPLAIGGIGRGGLEIRAHATLHTTPQRGGIVLIFEGRPVQRMNVWPEHDHFNPLRKDVPDSQRGVRLAAGVSRSYPWDLNRRWPRSRGDNLDVAMLAGPFSDYAAAAAWFATTCNVVGDIPLPPWSPRMVE